MPEGDVSKLSVGEGEVSKLSVGEGEVSKLSVGEGEVSKLSVVSRFTVALPVSMVEVHWTSSRR